MKDTKMFFLDTSDPEFKYAFGQFSDPVMYNEKYGESLQYMGTVVYSNGDIKHEFRHRALPDTNLRKYWQIPVSAKFKQQLENNEITINYF